MAKWTVRILWWLLVLTALVILLCWLVLAAPFFVDVRRNVVENVLSEQIGQPIHVRDDVRIVVGPISRIYVGGVEIPSENIAETNLAELNVLELDLDLFALFERKIDLDNLRVDGLQVNMLMEEDGTTSWTKTDRNELRNEFEKGSEQDKPTEGKDGEEEPRGSLFGFLSTRTATFTSIGLTIDNETSGFKFVYELKNLNLEQLDDGARVGVMSEGTVNGQLFSVKGNYPRGAPFTTSAAFGAVELNFDGEPIPMDQGGGFIAELTLDTGEIGDFLEVLGLTRTLEGRGKLTASITSKYKLLNIEGLEAVVDLSEGQQFTASGSVENLVSAEGFDIVVGGRLYPEGKPPKQAKKLAELELEGFSAHIVSQDKSLKFDDLEVTTNAFDQDIKQVGPISIDRIHRTEDGHLALEDVTIQAGPLDAPYIVAKGDLLNLLEFEGLTVAGELNAPASLLLKKLGDDVADAFGAVKAEFSVDDSQGHISLNTLDAYTVDTKVWALKAHAELGNVKELSALDFDFDLDIQDGAQFLGALKLEEVDVGPLEITASMSGKGKDFSTSFGLLAGESRIAANLETTVKELIPNIDGKIHSKRLNIADLKNGIAAVVQLSKIGGDEEGNAETEKDEEREIQPLVLPKETETEETDEREMQPLVLSKEENKPKDLVSLESLLTDTDLFVAIDIEEIAGQQGVSSLSSELSSKEGKASIGPIEATFGGGYFNVSANMDLVKSPDWVSVSGATSGWDLGEILSSLGLKIDAHGPLRGNFAVTGNRASVKTFVNSMSGSASLSMSKGKIATSLIELAGLGVFPWLFSNELAQGYTDIVCVVAPISIKAGSVSFNSVVAETKSVQLVAKGALDWKKDAISIRAEPRKVGKPLSRSAWPFNVSGKLSEPKFKLDIGGSTKRRVDGADKMPAERKPCTSDMQQLR